MWIQDSYQLARNDRSTLRQTMVSALANATVTTIAAVQMVSSTLSQVTGSPTELTRDSQVIMGTDGYFCWLPHNMLNTLYLTVEFVQA